MDVSNLEKGQVFNSKVELYRVIGIEPASGKKNRSYQDREVARYISFQPIEKGKRKIVINEIFDTPKDKRDNRGRHGNQVGNSVYALYMDILVLDMMKKHKNVDDTYSNIFLDKIPLFTTRYKDVLNNNLQNILRKHKISRSTLITYCEIITNKVKLAFEKSLIRLEKKGILECRHTYKVKYKKDGVESTASQEEIEYIKKVEFKLYEKLGIKNNEYISLKKRMEIKRRTLLYLRHDKKIYSFWKTYNIVLINEKVKNSTGKEVKAALEQLMKLFIIATHKTIHNKKGTKSTLTHIVPCQEEDIHIISKRSYYPFASMDKTREVLVIDSLMWNNYVEFIDEENKSYQWVQADNKWLKSVQEHMVRMENHLVANASRISKQERENNEKLLQSLYAELEGY